MDVTSLSLGLSNILCGGITIAVSIPLVQGTVKPNRLYGVRLRASFTSDEAWYDINRFGGCRLILWSFPLMLFGVITLFLPLGTNLWAIIPVACAPLILIVPALESWRYAKRYQPAGK